MRYLNGSPATSSAWKRRRRDDPRRLSPSQADLACNSARICGQGAERGRLCACLAETECKLTALNAATDGMTFAEEDDYLKRTDPIRTALYAEQQKLLRALATAPVRSASDIVELARVTVLLTADDVWGLQVLTDNLDAVLYRVLRCVAAAPLTAVFGH